MASVRRFSGTRLRELREDRRILQDDLSHRLRTRGFGTTQAQISRWESGQQPRAYILAALADELGVKVDELYGDDEDEESALPLISDDVLDALAFAIEAAREKKARALA